MESGRSSPREGWTGRAFVLHPTTLERFGCGTVGEFLELLRRTRLWPEYVPLPRPGSFSEPSLAVETDYRIVPPGQVTPLERAILDHIQIEHRFPLLREGYGGDSARERQFMLGESPHAAAWTDGSSHRLGYAARHPSSRMHLSRPHTRRCSIGWSPPVSRLPSRCATNSTDAARDARARPPRRDPRDRPDQWGGKQAAERIQAVMRRASSTFHD